MKLTIPAWLVILGCLFCLGNALTSARKCDYTFDEYSHLEFSRRLWDERTTDRSRYDQNSKTPVILLNIAFEKVANLLNIEEWHRLKMMRRLPGILWMGLLLLAVYLFTRGLAGETAARLATLGLSLDPNIAAHSSVIAVDVAFAAITVLLTWAMVLYAQKPTPRGAVAVGLGFGLALSTKFTAILFIPLVLFTAYWSCRHRKETYYARNRRLLLFFVCWAGLTCVVSMVAYLFVGVGTALSQITFISWPFQTLAWAMPWLRLPLPSALLTGIDICFHHERTMVWNVVLFGHWYPNGVWYYFPALWLFKTPLALLAAQAIGVLGLKKMRGTKEKWVLRLLGAQILLFLIYFSFLFRTQVGYRYVLMVLPLVWILVAGTLAKLKWRGHFRWAALFGLFLLVAENAVFWGNPLSFSNSLILPKKNAYRVLADSNIDWNHTYASIQEEMTAKQVITHFNPPHFVPGHNTINVNVYAGVLLNFNQFRWARANLTPTGHLLHTFLTFEVTPEQFERFLEEDRRLASFPEDELRCANLYTVAEPGSWVTFSQGQNANQCIRAHQNADLVVKAMAGQIQLGHYVVNDVCSTVPLSSGQELWFRLQPGIYRLCYRATTDSQVQISYRPRGSSRQLTTP